MKLGGTLIAFFVISFTIVGITSYKLPVEPRHFIYLLPILLIYISFGIERIYAAIREKYYNIPKSWIIAVILLCIILINIPMLSFYYTENTKSDYAGLSQKLSNITNDNNIVVLVPGGTQRVFELYYNSNEDNTRVYYATSNATLAEIYTTRHTCCSCTPSCTPWRMVMVITSDIKYDPNGEYYNAWIKEKKATFITKYDSFEIYDLQ
jgi:hypothetical protein